MEFSPSIFRRRIAGALTAGERGSSGNGQTSLDPTSANGQVHLGDLCAVPNDEDFVQQAYRRVLGRECDACGLANCLDILRTHASRRVVLLELVKSDEARQRGLQFTGIPDASVPAVGSRVRRAFGHPFRYATGLAYEAFRRIWLSPWQSVQQKLSLVLREVAVRSDGLSAKVDQVHWALSKKLDAYAVGVQQQQIGTGERVDALERQVGASVEAAEEHLEILQSAIKNVERRSLEAAHGQQQNQEVIRALQVAVTALAERQQSAVEQLRTIRSVVDDVRAVALRSDGLSAKVDQVHWALSEKLDAYSVGETQNQERIRALQVAVTALAEQQQSDVEQLRTVRSLVDNASQRSSSAIEEMRRAVRPPVIDSGDDVVVTEVDGLIIGIPKKEWRLAAYHVFRGMPEPGVVRRFREIIKPGMVVVDIGANIGFYTLQAARKLSGRGRVYGFEPAPATFKLLRENVQVNGFLETGAIELRQLAITDRTGTAELAVFPDNCGHNTLFFEGDVGHVTVPTASLDEALQTVPEVDVVKIDAEGAEPSILRGMRSILNRNPRIRVLLEFAPVHLRRAGVLPRDFLNEIASAGLEVHRIHDESGELSLTTSEELEKVFSANLELQRRGAAQ